MSSAEAAEAELARFFEDCVDARRSFLSYVLSHPFRSMSAQRAVHALPEVVALPSPTGEGPGIRHGLERSARIRTGFHSVTAVLSVPTTLDEYVSGASKQTLRRKVRAANKLGVVWRPVDDPAERRELVERADAHERSNPRTAYRDEAPDNTDLFDYDMWMGAFAADGRPLMLSVTPFEREWAVLRYFRTMEISDEATLSRYFMTQVLIEQLIARGVRHLADTMSPANLTNGLRQFQRMVGFRLVRVRLMRPVQGPAHPGATAERPAEAPRPFAERR